MLLRERHNIFFWSGGRDSEPAELIFQFSNIKRDSIAIKLSLATEQSSKMKFLTAMSLLGLFSIMLPEIDAICCPIDHVEPFINVAICKGLYFCV